MTFEKYDASSGRGTANVPIISIRSSASIGINKAAMGEWFDDADAVAVYMDEENDQVGLEPLESEAEGSYTLSETNGSGTVAASGFLNSYGLVPERTTQYRPDYDDDEGLIVIDLDDPVGTYGDADEGSEGSEE